MLGRKCGGRKKGTPNKPKQPVIDTEVGSLTLQQIIESVVNPHELIRRHNAIAEGVYIFAKTKDGRRKVYKTKPNPDANKDLMHLYFGKPRQQIQTINPDIDAEYRRVIAVVNKALFQPQQENDATD